MNFSVKFITHKGQYKQIVTNKLNVPALDGRRGILSNHMPVIMPIVPGVIETNEDGKLHHYIISNGMLYFENNDATIASDFVIDESEINIERIKERKKHITDNMNDVYHNELLFIDEIFKYMDIN